MSIEKINEKISNFVKKYYDFLLIGMILGSVLGMIILGYIISTNYKDYGSFSSIFIVLSALLVFSLQSYFDKIKNDEKERKNKAKLEQYIDDNFFETFNELINYKRNLKEFKSANKLNLEFWDYIYSNPLLDGLDPNFSGLIHQIRSTLKNCNENEIDFYNKNFKKLSAYNKSCKEKKIEFKEKGYFYYELYGKRMQLIENVLRSHFEKNNYFIYLVSGNQFNIELDY